MTRDEQLAELNKVRMEMFHLFAFEECKRLEAINLELLEVLKLFVAVDDATGPLISTQGQGMDGYSKLANYDSCVIRARKIIDKTE